MSKVSLYIKQSFTHLKRDLLVIAGLAIGLSIIFGMNYYGDSYRMLVQHDLDSQFQDFYFQVKFNEGLLDQYQDEVDSILTQHSNFKNASNYQSYVMKSSNFFITSTESNSPLNSSSHPFPSADESTANSYLDSNFVQLWNINLLSPGYYESSYFDRCFQLVAGRVPQQENEILVDWSLAERMLWEMGDYVNISYGCASTELTLPPTLNGSFNFQGAANDTTSVNNIYIAGIYCSKNPELTIMGNFDYHWTYDWKGPSAGGSDLAADSFNVVNNTKYLDTPILGYFNSSADPLDYYFVDINAELSDNSPFPMLETSFISIMGFYQISEINFHRISSETKNLEEQMLSIQLELNNYMGFEFSLLERLSPYEEKVSFVLLGMQLMNLPLILFVLLIAGFAIRSDIRNRVEDLVLLKSKGTPNSIIINTLFSETAMIGVLSSLVGCFLGYFSFQLINRSVSQFIISENISIIPFDTNWQTYGINILIGLAIATISTLVSVFFVTKLSVNQLMGFMGQNVGEIDYDVPALFDSKDSQKQENQLKDKDRPRDQPRRDKADGGYETYLENTQGQFSKSEGSKAKKARVSVAWVMIIFGLTPFIYYGLKLLSRKISFPDFMQEAIHFCDINTTLMMVIFILAPITMIIGFVRILFVEHPRIFAQISRGFSLLLPKSLRKISVLNTVKKRSYTTLILIMGILITGYTSLNITLNSLVRYSSLSYNIKVGADIRLDLKTIVYVEDWKYQGLTNNYNLSCLADFQSMEKDMLNLNSTEGGPLLKEMVTAFQVLRFGGVESSLILMNFTKYLALVHADESKFQYSEDLAEKFQMIIDYNSNLSQGQNPGLLGNEAYWNIKKNLQNGEFFYYSLYDKDTNADRLAYVYGNVLDFVSVLPGWSGDEFDRPFIIADYHAWMLREPSILGINDNSALPSFQIKQFIDIDNSKIPLTEEDRQVIEACIHKYTLPIHTFYYNWNWDHIQANISQITTKIYSVFYLEFFTLGIVISIGMAILFLNIQKADKFHNGVLFARGLGKRNIHLIMNYEFIQVFVIASLIGLGIGFACSMPILEYSKMVTFPNYQNLHLPIFFELGRILLYVSILPVITLVLFNIGYAIGTRRNSNSYFQNT